MLALLCRSNDGRTLAVTSSDGYCSLVTFDPGELGTPLEPSKLPAAVARQPCMPPTATEQGVFKSPSPHSRNGAREKEGEDVEPKTTSVKPRRIRPTTIATFGSPDRTQGNSSPSVSPSSSQQHLTSSQQPPVEGVASDPMPPCVEGVASDPMPPCVEGVASDPKPPCVKGGEPVVEVPRKNPSGPRRVNFITLSSPAPKPPDEAMEVELLTN